MQRVVLERVRRHLNEEKFYEVSVDSDLFGYWILERRCGRIGSEGDMRSASFEVWEVACETARDICRIKLARGYHVVSDPHRLVPLELLPPEDGQTRLLRAAEALERLLHDLPAHRDGRFGRITASLASACRLRRSRGERWVPAGQRRAEWLMDDTDYRVRARIFQLMDELVSGVLTEDDEYAVFRMIQEASNPSLSGAAVRLVPRTKHSLLDQPVAGFFASDRELSELGLDLADQGVRFVGELVQLSFGEIMSLARGNRAIVGRLEDRLAAVGLPLNGRAPGWQAPERSALHA